MQIGVFFDTPIKTKLNGKFVDRYTPLNEVNQAKLAWSV